MKKIFLILTVLIIATLIGLFVYDRIHESTCNREEDITCRSFERA